MSIYKDKIAAIQNALKERQLDAALFLTADPHASEYIPSHYAHRAAICGFSGSAGSLIITPTNAFLCTDGRYFIQAAKELANSGCELVKSPDVVAKLTELSPKTCAIDFACLSAKTHDNLSEICQLVDINLAHIAYTPQPLEFHQIYLAPYKPRTSCEKLQAIRSELAVFSAHIISALDDIAWLCNLRGCDVEYNPVFLAYFILTPTSAFLYCHKLALSQQASEYLASQDIQVCQYEDFFADAAQLSGLIVCEKERTNMKVINAISHARLKDQINPSSFLKSQKTKEEIALMQQAHVIEGAALVRFYMQLERLISQNAALNEAQISTMLIEQRKQSKEYVTESFSAIAATSANAAIAHYHASSDNSAQLKAGALLLIDTGAQYFCGTTDITRVVILGGSERAAPSELEQIKADYTTVLKAHIAMASTVHKEGVAMPMLDAIARSQLWARGLDYNHGTGHGVGCFLNVHEGPQTLSIYAQPSAKTAVRRGMITSIEPGVYHEGRYGIRLENLYESRCVFSSEYGDFLAFFALSLFPFETSLIDLAQLSATERRWLNDYHQMVLSRLSKQLNDQERNWLAAKCQQI